MGYYRGAAGDFYRGFGRAGVAAGDYYRGRGDFWSKAKKALKPLAKKVGEGVANYYTAGGYSLVKGAMSSGGGMPGGGVSPSAWVAPTVRTIGTAIAKNPKTAAAVAAGLGLPSLDFDLGVPGPGIFSSSRKRRSMNAGNAAALRRALRRVDAFRNLAKKSGAMPAVRRLQASRGCGTCGKTKCSC